MLAGRKREDNAKLLFFYSDMAIAAYSFGDYKEAKEYADKTLSLNDKINDSKRGDKTKASQVRAEMEAIKNDKY